MRRLFDLSIGKKIGAGYLAMAFLLLISGGAGYLATQQLANSLNFITGPVNATAAAVSEGIRGVQTQMIAVDNALRTSQAEAQTELEAGQQLTDQAVTKITSAGIVSQEQLSRLLKTLERFNNARESLLSLDKQFRQTRSDLEFSTRSGRELLQKAEGIASQKLVDAEWNINRSEDNDSDVRDSEEWNIVSSTTDARLALLSHLSSLELLLKNPGNQDVQAKTQTNFEDFKLYLELIAESELLRSREVSDGEYAKQTFSKAFGNITQRHEMLSQQLLSRHQELEKARGNYRAVADNLLELAVEFEKRSDQVVKDQLASVDGAAESSLVTMAALLLAGLLIAAGFYWLNIRFIAKPIGSLAERLADIAEGEGDLSVTLETNDGRDEIAQVSRSFNQFTGKIRDAIAEVQNAVNHLTSSSSRLQQVTASNIERMQAQQQHTSQVANSMQLMASNMDSVASSAEGALDSANQTNERANAGQTQVGETMNSIQMLASQVEEADVTINQLVSESDAIGGVLDVIGGIAEQTNLLALNAAIEAARAGEQGRGFAVVADEVRTLASRTQQSTAEIQGMIERLQSGAKKAALVMDSSRASAQATVEQGGATGSTFGDIVESAASIQHMNEQIASAVEQQRANTDEVSRSIASMSEASEEIVNGSAEISEASHSLADLSNQLQRIVQQFRI